MPQFCTSTGQTTTARSTVSVAVVSSIDCRRYSLAVYGGNEIYRGDAKIKLHGQ